MPTGLKFSTSCLFYLLPSLLGLFGILVGQGPQLARQNLIFRNIHHPVRWERFRCALVGFPITELVLLLIVFDQFTKIVCELARNARRVIGSDGQTSISPDGAHRFRILVDGSFAH